MTLDLAMQVVPCLCIGGALSLMATLVLMALKDPGGLTPNHHGELNRRGISPGHYDALREEYIGDAVAQQQIDVYDGSTEYHDHFRDLVSALKSGDAVMENQEVEWFERYYPDV